MTRSSADRRLQTKIHFFRARMLVVGLTLVWLAFAAIGPRGVAANPLDGRWERFHREPISHSASVYDPLRNRLLAVGGLDRSNFPTNRCQFALWGDDIVWEDLVTSGPLPAVWGHSLIYDSARDRVLVFGGMTSGGLSNAVWSLPLTGAPVWTALVTTGTPPVARFHHTGIYDPVRDRMIIFAGTTGTRLNDTWALDLGVVPAQWSKIEPQSGVPAPRAGPIAAYDAGHRLMVIHGGDGHLDEWNDAFALTLDGVPVWEFVPSGPKCSFHAAAVDGAQARMILFGGSLGRVPWTYSFETQTWNEMDVGGEAPNFQEGCGAAVNPTRSEFATFGGRESSSTYRFKLSPPGPWSKDLARNFLPSPRVGDVRIDPSRSPAIVDPIRRRIVLVVGGVVWQFPLDGPYGWEPLEIDGPGPSARSNEVMVYDSAADRAILYGGDDGWNTFADLWELRFSGQPAWSPLTAVNSPGTATGGAAVYDPVRRRMLLDGGYNLSQGEVCSVAGGSSVTVHSYGNAVWSLDLNGAPVWAPEPYVPSYEGHATIYDSRHDRFDRFGGVRIQGFCVNDGFGHPHSTYTYSLQDVLEELDPATGTTTSIAHAPGPLPRGYLQAVFDPRRNCVYVFGGGPKPTEPIAGLWRWELVTRSWSQLDPDGMQPAGRTACAMVYDEQQDKVWMFGGVGDSSTWRFTPPDAPTPIVASLAESHVSGGTAYVSWWVDPERAALMRVQRSAAHGPWLDLALPVDVEGSTIRISDPTIEPGVPYGYRLAWGIPPDESWAGEAWIQDSRLPLKNSLRIEGASPVRGRIALHVQLAGTARARVHLLDLRGRSVHSVAVDPARGADQIVELSPAGALSAGIYWARLFADGGSTTLRLVYLP